MIEIGPNLTALIKDIGDGLICLLIIWFFISFLRSALR